MAKETKKKSKVLAVFWVVFLVIVVAIVVGLMSGEGLKYTIVEKEDTSLPGTPRMVYRVVVEVEEIPTNEELEKTALEIWKDGNKHWEWFTVFMYLPGMDTGNVPYGVAHFKPEGLEFRIQEAALYGTKWES